MVHEMLEEGVQVSALSLPRLMTPQGEGCLQTLAKLEEKEERTPRGDAEASCMLIVHITR